MERAEQQGKQLEALQGRLAEFDAPLLVRMWRGLWRLLFGRRKPARWTSPPLLSMWPVPQRAVSCPLGCSDSAPGLP